MLADKAKVEGSPIQAILAPAELRGYVIIEAQTPHIVDELIRGMRHTRERVQGTISPDEVDHYIETKPVVEGLEEGTLVEVIAGPFKGMQARELSAWSPQKRRSPSRYLRLPSRCLSQSTLTMSENSKE